MKVLHICTSDRGGAGNAAYRIHLGLKLLDAKSKMLVLKRTLPDKHVEKFEGVKRTSNTYKKTSFKKHDFFSDDRTGYRIAGHPLVTEADIIHLHWIAGMVDYRDFFCHINKPVVWTLHDENPFTGGCHFTNGCEKYVTGCGSCPQLESKKKNDLSRGIFKRKERAYNKKQIHFVVLSKYSKMRAGKSALLKAFKISMIPHGVPEDIFRRRNRNYSRDKLKLPRDKTIILFGSDYKTARKGLVYLARSMKHLLKEKDLSKVALVVFGAYRDIDIPFIPGLKTYNLGYFFFEDHLSLAYSSADITVVPSLEESFSFLCVESMACGIPVVGFNVGVIPELVIPHKTGLVVEVKDYRDMADKIEYMIDYPGKRRQMGRNARKLIEEKYSLKGQAKRYRALYAKILKPLNKKKIDLVQ